MPVFLEYQHQIHSSLWIPFKAKKVPKDIIGLANENLMFTANDAAWMNFGAFEEWINKIWTPYGGQFRRSLLIMDSFQVHKIPRNLEKLKELNTDMLIIPSDLTFYIQPVDVYINGPIKQHLRQSWQKLVLFQFSLLNLTRNSP